MSAPDERGVRLVRGGLTGRIYAVTRWKATPERGVDAWEAIEKFDVTDDFDVLCENLSDVAQRAEDRDRGADLYVSTLVELGASDAVIKAAKEARDEVVGEA
jgi:hypothetical protein